MIIIVDDRPLVTEAYRISFDREGIASAGFTQRDFASWIEAASIGDLDAVRAILIGDGERVRGLARSICRRSNAATIALRECKSLETTLQLFAEGFDDVVLKPCHVKELLARVEAISRRRRTQYPRNGSSEAIRCFLDGRDPLVFGRPVSLPRRELRILEFLVSNGSRRVTRTQIFNSVYGLFEQGIEETVIESHISRLRRRLKSVLGYDPIETRRHLGYRLVSRSAGDGAVIDQQVRPRLVDSSGRTPQARADMV